MLQQKRRCDFGLYIAGPRYASLHSQSDARTSVEPSGSSPGLFVEDIMGLGSPNRVASRDTISKMSPRAQPHEIERLARD